MLAWFEYPLKPECPLESFGDVVGALPLGHMFALVPRVDSLATEGGQRCGRGPHSEQ
jgi:hypothetical protein